MSLGLRPVLRIWELGLPCVLQARILCLLRGQAATPGLELDDLVVLLLTLTVLLAPFVLLCGPKMEECSSTVLDELQELPDLVQKGLVRS